MRDLRTRVTIRGAVCLFFVLAATCCLAREYHVPDPDLGIVSISDALSRTQPGDVVRIAEGYYYESLTITTPSLTLIGEGKAMILGAGEATTSGLVVRHPPFLLEKTQDLRLVNLDILGLGGVPPPTNGRPASDSSRRVPAYPPVYPGLPPPSAIEAIVATTSSLTLDGCIVEVDLSDPIPAIRASNSTLVVRTSSIEGSPGYYAGSSSPPANGGDGLVLVQSCCTATSSVIQGGKGGDGSDISWSWYHVPGTGADGGIGVTLNDNSRIQLEDCVVTGGDGGDGYKPDPFTPGSGGNGGDGIHATENSLVQTAQTLIAGGSGGISRPLSSSNGAPGEPTVLDSGSVSLETPSREDQVQLIVKRGPPFPSDADQTDFNSDGFLDVADIVVRFRFCSR